MSLITDGLLIATCLTAALYCAVLSRRLRKLTDTDEGIGQQIMTMNASVEEMRAALKEMRASARGASERLAREIHQARQTTGELSQVIESARKLHTHVPYPAEPEEKMTPSIDPKKAAADYVASITSPAKKTGKMPFNQVEDRSGIDEVVDKTLNMHMELEDEEEEISFDDISVDLESLQTLGFTGDTPARKKRLISEDDSDDDVMAGLTVEPSPHHPHVEEQKTAPAAKDSDTAGDDAQKDEALAQESDPAEAPAVAKKPTTRKSRTARRAQAAPSKKEPEEPQDTGDAKSEKSTQSDAKSPTGKEQVAVVQNVRKTQPVKISSAKSGSKGQTAPALLKVERVAL